MADKPFGRQPPSNRRSLRNSHSRTLALNEAAVRGALAEARRTLACVAENDPTTTRNPSNILPEDLEKRKYPFVPRVDDPKLVEEIEEFVYDALIFPDVPSHINFSASWIVDQKVPLERLPAGVAEVKLSWDVANSQRTDRSARWTTPALESGTGNPRRPSPGTPPPRARRPKLIAPARRSRVHRSRRQVPERQQHGRQPPKRKLPQREASSSACRASSSGRIRTATAPMAPTTSRTPRLSSASSGSWSVRSTKASIPRRTSSRPTRSSSGSESSRRPSRSPKLS